MPVTINGTTGISFPDGSSGAPALRGTDSDTGVFFPAADTIALVEGGTEVLRINSSGNVGIGTTNPAEKLQVQGRVVGTSGLRAGTTAAIASSGEALSVLGQATIRLDSPTSAATYIINADTTASTIQPFLLCNDTGGNRAGIGVENSSAIASFYGHLGISLQTGSTAFGYANERLRITSTGNIGIGTTTSYTVGGNYKVTILASDILSAGPNNSNMFYIRYQGSVGDFAWQTVNSGSNAGSIQLQPYGGNVGIGTTNPLHKLDVTGGAIKADAVYGLRYENNTTVDTGIFVGSTNFYSAVFEVTVSGNPNHNGSGAYRSSSTYILHVGTGWTGSDISTMLSATRIAFVAGGPNANEVTATFVLWNGSTEGNNRARNGADQLRIKVVGASTSAGAVVYVKQILSQ